jgi:hypothetical protein
MTITTHTALSNAGMLDLAEQICLRYGVTLEQALSCSRVYARRKARHAMFSVLFMRGWSQNRIATTFGYDHKTISNAIDRVLVSEVRGFLPKAEVA